ncbi:MAG: hypothetical protein P9E88_02910 [Candidatus Competibacter sp.]|nr:hypothetical protein [Candidatus Competibacter sp.]
MSIKQISKRCTSLAIYFPELLFQLFYCDRGISMTIRWVTRPAWRLVFMIVLALLSGQVAVAVQPSSDGSSTVCSGTLTEIGSVLPMEVATAEDIQAFHKAVGTLRIELDAVCKQDKSALKLFKAKAKQVIFEMSAGATEPTAYLKNGQLIVEFYGGPFDARSFRQIVKKVLQGQKVPQND